MDGDGERSGRVELYAERALSFRARADALALRTQRWMNVGAIAVLVTGLVCLAVLLGSAPPWVLLAAAAGVATSSIAFVRRARLEQAEDEAQRRWRVNADAEARCRDGWRSLPDDGSRFIDPAHAHSSDLDVFGPSSLFQLINVAHTAHGQRALSRLLSDCVGVSESRVRQQAVRRLAPELELRQTLETLTLSRAPKPDARALLPRFAASAPAPRTDTEALLEWIDAPSRLLQRRALLLAARVLPVLTLGSLLAWAALDAPSLLWKLGVMLQGVLAFRTRRDVAQLYGIVGHWQGAFSRLARAFEAMGALPLDTPRLGPRLRGWLEALGELEALSSLAGAAHDHAELTFPEWADDAPCFVATALGHPLLAPSARIDNDVCLPAPGHALLVTGSNMSGKSTLLRAIGLASVMAMAGGPVCARQLRLGAFALHTSLRVTDSLSANVSHFYAELQRLRAMLSATQGRFPLLFLVDEILAGTNSLERGIGARWLLAELLRAGALGALSTHDGSLCQLPPELMPRVERVHFRETFEAGALAFDYRLHPGPVQAGNALRLMRSMGLAVAH
ncbi:MAG TPA: hypothetical protein VMG12_03575 [Polyangiaceae bacterium]|nr:hypothetical protein [Polyangiaceae bacterium]